MVHINALPRDILIHIFTFYLQTETQRKFLNCIAKVCVQWRNISMDASLWKKFDGTLPFRTLQFLCKKKCLQRVEELKLCSISPNATKRSLLKIYSSMPHLKCLNFSHVKTLNEEYLTDLADQCSELCEIVCNESQSSFTHLINCRLFDNLLKIRGSKFVTLNFSNTAIAKCSVLFKHIATFCPNLTKLYVENLHYSSLKPLFPIEQVQRGCPKLKVLRLGYPIRYSVKNKKLCCGFPNLEVFAHSSAYSDCYFPPNDFIMLLFLSPNLKVLDIRGCEALTADSICSLPSNVLESLFVSKSDVLKSMKMIQILLKWSCSLKELDISRTNIDNIDYKLCSIITQGGLRELEILHLNGSNISLYTLKMILQNCLKLQFLQLQACRAVKRQYRNIYYGKLEIQNLLTEINSETVNVYDISCEITANYFQQSTKLEFSNLN